MVSEADKELYQYAVYSLLLTLSPIMLAVVFGVCMGSVGQSIMIIIPFTVIRKFSGGYHAKYAWTCQIGSCLLLLLCIVLSFWLQAGLALSVITVGAVASLMYFSPIDNENRRLSQEEQACYKRVTAILAILFLCASVLLWFCKQHTYSVCISIGIILTAGLQVLAVLDDQIKTKNVV